MTILLERSSSGSASADGSMSQITQADESDAARADIGLRTNERNSCLRTVQYSTVELGNALFTFDSRICEGTVLYSLLYCTM